VPATFRTQVHEYGLFPLNKTLKSDSSSFHRLRTHFLVPILGTLHHQGLSLRPSATARQRCEHTTLTTRTNWLADTTQTPPNREKEQTITSSTSASISYPRNPRIKSSHNASILVSSPLYFDTRHFLIKSTILLCPLKILTSSHHESVPYERRCQGYAKGSFQLAACVCYRERLYGWVLVWL
jgi:hypothetical protein